MPWTAGNDAQAAVIRAFNVNYAAWCETNAASLIHCHDAMARVRPSTGKLDDMKTTYNYDGVHLTTAGLAALIAEGVVAGIY